MEHADPTDPHLFEEITTFIGDPASGSFENLILRLYRRQYALNKAYAVFCDNLAATPETVRDWNQIPAIPARAFKIAELTCTAPEQIATVFHSSGTTDAQPGRHFLDAAAVELYRTSLRRGFYNVVSRDLPILALMPPLGQAPNSSLSFMLDDLGAESFFWADLPRLSRGLNQAVKQGAPICLFATAFALLELFDDTTENWRLPAGSIVIETGGFKGRTRQVSREDLYALIAERLGVTPPSAMAEYGMSEMASQYYGAPSTGLTAAPHLRSRIIDPFIEQEAGEGLLRHYDLANWNSVAVIQTQDRARRLPSGAYELLGRAPQAELRGCSLTVEERWIESAAQAK